MRAAVAYENLGVLYWAREAFQAAERHIERSLAINVFEPNHPQVAKTLGMLGVVDTELRKFSIAENYLTEALEIQEKALGPEHPDLAETLGGLAEFYRAQSDFTMAAPLYARANEIRAKSWGRDSPAIVETLRDCPAPCYGKRSHWKTEPTRSTPEKSQRAGATCCRGCGQERRANTQAHIPSTRFPNTSGSGSRCDLS